MAFNPTILAIFVICHRLICCETMRQITIVSPGFFGFNAFPSLSYNGPAIETGVQRLRQTFPQFNWTSKYLHDEEMSSCIAVLDNIQNVLSRWYYTERDPNSLSMIIAPGCFEGIYLNQLVSEWDLLLVTSAAADDLIKDRQRSPTWLTTTGYPPSNEVYCSILAFFNWTKVYVCQDRDDPTEYFGYIAGQIKSHLIACGVQFTQIVFSSSEKSVSTTSILQEFNMKSRDAVKLNMTSGEHVYLAPIPWTSKAFGNFTWQMFDNNDQIVRQAYRSVILLTLMDESAFTSRGLRNLTSAWKQISQNVYNNTDLQFELPLPDMVDLQAAIEISGIVAQEILEQSELNKVPSGRAIANMAMNRTYDLQVGHTHMTAFGHGSYKVHASYFDLDLGSFQTFLQSAQLSHNDQFTWNAVTEGRWFNRSTFPPDEPRCGFDGNREICLELGSHKSSTYLAMGVTISSIAVIWITSAVLWCRYRLAQMDMRSWWQLEGTIDFLAISCASILKNKTRPSTLIIPSR